ncbi:MAG: bifunctional glycosyltransferase family 2/GtrA family protein [Clostridia bacterium]|nr:bifunctional glycosyltransferase family 2/GtrA family protein [Clostridia bacterium]
MKTALIVPAYRPTEDMIPMLRRFVDAPDYVPVVVNDGSGPAYDAIFERIPEGCIRLEHEVNRGKGAALKTAIGYVLEHLPECTLAVTADADGQHQYEDILRVVRSAREHPGTLVLGSRAFDGDVPFKSRWGNAITRHVFSIASGVKVYDTQTGLRAFDRTCMEKFLNVPGDRYEYEINMLLYAAREGIAMREETIRTIYIDDNSASSFHPFRDSFKIYACILKYAMSSIIAFLVDWCLFELLARVPFGLGAAGDLTLSQVLARVVSATVNFVINKKVVFQSKGDWKREFAKYAALAVAVMVCNILLMRLLNGVLGWNYHICYVLIQVVMYISNFVLQGKLVYNRGRKG